MRQRVLVTGGCGFIGQELVQQLVDRGDDVWVLDHRDRAATGWDRVHALIGGQLVQGDVQVPAHVLACLEALPDVCLHVAAQSHVDVSLREPDATWASNALGTQVVARLCTELGVPLLYCSTDEVYGSTTLDEDGQPVPLGEDAPLLPSSPYSASKAAGELAVRAMGHSAGLRWTITRGSNAWGFHQLGEKLIPLACGMLAQRNPVPLHGGGDQLRSWVHVSEFAQALLLAADALVDGAGHGKVYNLAGAEVRSVRQIVQLLAQEAGVPEHAATWDSADRPGQDLAYCVSGTRIARDLGWQPVRCLTDPDELEALLGHYKTTDTAPMLAHYVAGEAGRTA